MAPTLPTYEELLDQLESGIPVESRRVLLENDECPVCKELFREPVKTGCRHRYCWDCVTTQLLNEETCPTCRTTLPHHNSDTLDGMENNERSEQEDTSESVNQMSRELDPASTRLLDLLESEVPDRATPSNRRDHLQASANYIVYHGLHTRAELTEALGFDPLESCGYGVAHAPLPFINYLMNNGPFPRDQIIQGPNFDTDDDESGDYQETTTVRDTTQALHAPRHPPPSTQTSAGLQHATPD